MDRTEEFLEIQSNIIEDLQEAITLAGGTQFRRKRLLAMTLEELMDNFLPNHIEFNFRFVDAKEREK